MRKEKRKRERGKLKWRDKGGERHTEKVWQKGREKEKEREI